MYVALQIKQQTRSVGLSAKSAITVFDLVQMMQLNQCNHGKTDIMSLDMPYSASALFTVKKHDIATLILCDVDAFI